METLLILLVVFGVYGLGALVSMRPMYRWRVHWADETYSRYYRANFLMDDAWWVFWMSFVWPAFWAWRILRAWITL